MDEGIFIILFGRNRVAGGREDLMVRRAKWTKRVDGDARRASGFAEESTSRAPNPALVMGDARAVAIGGHVS